MSKAMGCPFGCKPEGDNGLSMDADDEQCSGTAKDMASIAENQGLTWGELNELYDMARGWEK
jgi:hypothetical protein